MVVARIEPIPEHSHMPYMTNKASHEQTGWVVRVTSPDWRAGNAPAPEIWDVAMPDPNDAVRTVSECIRAIDERVEAVQTLSAATIRGFGLKVGQAKQRL
jgi:hypothetical protein